MNQIQNQNKNNEIKIFDKTFFITTFVCLIPVIIGLILYKKLPEQMAIHWNFSGNPDNFAHKNVSILGLPLICVFLNAICNLYTNFKRKKLNIQKESKFEKFAKWICVIICIFASSITYLYALEAKFDIVKIVLIFISLIFLIVGNYLPKAVFLREEKYISEETFNKYKRIIGILTFILGLINLITSFYSFGKYVFIISLILYMIINLVLFFVFKKK